MFASEELRCTLESWFPGKFVQSDLSDTVFTYNIGICVVEVTSGRSSLFLGVGEHPNNLQPIRFGDVPVLDFETELRECVELAEKINNLRMRSSE